MRIGEAAKVDGGRVGSMREGTLDQKFLLQGEDGSPNNYLLNVGLTGGGGWGTPRHRHNFDQIRYVLKGKYPTSPHKVMDEGTVAYFPESVHYGPQDRPAGLEMMVIQFGGASGSGFLSTPRREAANKALEAKGTFRDGIFTWIDASSKKHNMDGSAACYEEAMGRKLVLHPPRYDDVMIMNPEASSWMETGMPGVATKHLGTFTERNLRLGFIRIAAGATYNTGTRSQIEVLFASQGEFVVGGQTYGPKTGIELSPTDALEDITANTETLIFTVLLPKF